MDSAGSACPGGDRLQTVNFIGFSSDGAAQIPAVVFSEAMFLSVQVFAQSDAQKSFDKLKTLVPATTPRRSSAPTGTSTFGDGDPSHRRSTRGGE